MPSRFPGMDPYLESPRLWPDVHARLIAIISEQLAAALRPKYFVAVESRLLLLSADDPAGRVIVPDAAIYRTDRRRRQLEEIGAAPPTAVVVTMDEIEYRASRIAIKSVPDQVVVTVIELLSPASKTAGSEARADYLKKRADVLRSRAHMIEIDLLRKGLRIPAHEELPEGDYMVHVSRETERPSGLIWAWTVRQPIPPIPVPLMAPEKDGQLDLGAAVKTLYDRAGYDLILDYSKPASPPLSEADAAWAATLS